LVLPASAEVRVLLRIPEGMNGDSRGRIESSWPLVRSLLDGEARPFLSQDAQNRGIEMRYCAPGWSRMPDAERARVVGALKSKWGRNVRFQERSAGFALSSVAAPASIRLDLGAAKKAAGRAEARASLEGGSLFDGARARGAPGSAPGGVRKPWGCLSSPKNPLRRLAEAIRVPEPGPRGIEALVREEARAAGIDLEVLRALLAAKGGLSAGGGRVSGRARGLLLVTPAAAESVGMKGADLLDPRLNLRVAARLIARDLEFFEGDLHRALAAYEVGTGRVVASGGIPRGRRVRELLAAFDRAYGRSPRARSPSMPADALARLVQWARQMLSPLPPAGIPEDGPVSRYRKTVRHVASKRGVDPWLVESVMMAENPWGDPMRVSGEGAVGLMQLMPATARRFQVDPRVPEQNIDGGSRYLKELIDRFDGNRVLAVASYNGGPTRVARCGRIPDISETKNYVRKVFGFYAVLTGETVDYASLMPPPRERRHRRRARHG
jgi:soluble lytic murein transglycosylase-like protein